MTTAPKSSIASRVSVCRDLQLWKLVRGKAKQAGEGILRDALRFECLKLKPGPSPPS